MFNTLADIKRANQARGNFWFSPDTMRFFKSRISCRIHPDGKGGAYFVSSEQGPDGVRRYSVRYAQADGDIRTVGEFQGYRTSSAAHAAAIRLALLEPAY